MTLLSAAQRSTSSLNTRNVSRVTATHRGASCRGQASSPEPDALLSTTRRKCLAVVTDVDSNRLLGYDNAHGVGRALAYDHRHRFRRTKELVSERGRACSLKSRRAGLTSLARGAYCLHGLADTYQHRSAGLPRQAMHQEHAHHGFRGARQPCRRPVSAGDRGPLSAVAPRGRRSGPCVRGTPRSAQLTAARDARPS